MTLLRFISRFSRPRRGHSLIDVLIGITILAIALGSAFSLAAHNASLMQRNQRTALFCEQQDAGSLAVQAVDQLKEFRLRTFQAKLFDNTAADPAAAMHGQAGRLVDDQ